VPVRATTNIYTFSPAQWISCSTREGVESFIQRLTDEVQDRTASQSDEAPLITRYTNTHTHTYARARVHALTHIQSNTHADMHTYILSHTLTIKRTSVLANSNDCACMCVCEFIGGVCLYLSFCAFGGGCVSFFSVYICVCVSNRAHPGMFVSIFLLVKGGYV